MPFIILALMALGDCSGPSYSSDDDYGYDSGWDSGWDAPAPIESARYAWTGDSWAGGDGAGFIDNDRAVAAMGHNSCTFDPDGGRMLSDVDLAETPDDIRDVDEVVVVVSEDEGVTTLSNPAGERLQTRRIPGLVDARHDGGGDVVVVADDPVEGCSVGWHDERRRTLVPFLNEACELPHGFAVDRERGRVWVPGDNGIVEVTRDSATALDVRGDLLAWDRTHQLLYVATAGEPNVLAMEPGGTIRWEISLGSPVEHLKAMGRKGAALVALLNTDDTLDLVIVDGTNGTPTDGGVVHEAIVDMAVSPNGRRIALEGHEQVWYIREK